MRHDQVDDQIDKQVDTAKRRELWKPPWDKKNMIKTSYCQIGAPMMHPMLSI